MKIFLYVSAFLAISIPAWSRSGSIPHGPVDAKVAVCFTPDQDCNPGIVNAINNAKHIIRVQAYGFTSVPILKALLNAKKRGVDVQIILDKINDSARYSGATVMTNAAIPVWIDHRPKIAHNKLICIDPNDDTALTIGGSFNYTTASNKSNAENVEYTYSKEFAQFVIDNWESRKEVSTKYVR